MRSKRIRTNAYTTAIERRIRRFYVVLVLLGILAASLYFLITPYLARRSIGVTDALEPQVSGGQPPPAGVSSVLVQSLSNQVQELQAELKKSGEDYQLLQGMVADKERAFQELFDTYNREQKQYAQRRESVTQAEERAALAEKEQNRLQAELNAANARAASLAEKVAAFEQQATAMNDLMREKQDVTRARDEALAQIAALEQRLIQEEDDAVRQKKAMVALHERLQAGETNTVLLESVAMAQWRLLRYDAEWVLRKLDSAPTNACEDVIAPCRQRLTESLYASP